jgi:hypothetical protein
MPLYANLDALDQLKSKKQDQAGSLMGHSDAGLPPEKQQPLSPCDPSVIFVGLV